MTPEQLEAHRVRFEQRYAYDNDFELADKAMERKGKSYVSHYAHRAWQAYQWALADADRAQRAAQTPQQSAQPEAGTVTMLPMEHDDGRKAWYIDHPEFYCDVEPDADGKWSVFFRDKQGREGFADQAAQPVELKPATLARLKEWQEDGTLNERLILTGLQQERELAAAEKRIAELEVGLPAAQPVEVQPLTNEEICEIGKAAYAVEGNHILPVTFGRAIEARLRGIKPTSSKGGA